MAKKLLKGRLKNEASEFTRKFTASHGFDRRLYEEDISLSRAHIKMLASAKMISKKEHSVLAAGLNKVRAKIAAGKMKWRDELEDIHLHVEAELIKEVGEVGKKLHIGRSRNDQVATDIRLYARKEIDAIARLMLELCLKLAERAGEEHATLMPGFTHLQPAQPVTCGHHLLAWHSMLMRDYARMQDCRKRVNQMPLGSAALAGTSHPINRELLARELGFELVMDNSLDAVSSRDFIIELSAAVAICMQHLSRWSEELIIWSSQQFGFVELPDELCTGSSIMPQKKNPDLPELVRGKSGRATGNLVSILTIMKAQPLAYNKDNQEDKELLFDSLDTLKGCLTAWINLAAGVEFKRDKMAEAVSFGYMNATRLADYLAAKGVPFRKAYAIAGGLVRQAQEQGKGLEELSLAEMRAGSKEIGEDVYKKLDYKALVASYNHIGGSAPKRVSQAAKKAQTKTKKLLKQS